MTYQVTKGEEAITIEDGGEFLVAIDATEVGSLVGKLLQAMGLDLDAYPALVDYLNVDETDEVRENPRPFEEFGWKEYGE